jgi:hypothetical protein
VPANVPEVPVGVEVGEVVVVLVVVVVVVPVPPPDLGRYLTPDAAQLDFEPSGSVGTKVPV